VLVVFQMASSKIYIVFVVRVALTSCACGWLDKKSMNAERVAKLLLLSEHCGVGRNKRMMTDEDKLFRIKTIRDDVVAR